MTAPSIPLAALAQVAQAPAPPSREELAPPQAQPEARHGPTLTIDGQMERGPCALDDPGLAHLRVTLSAVSFSGAEAASDVSLRPAYEPYLGRDLPISVLCDIRARATALLSEAGYLAAVEIPEQRLAGGAAEFRVVLGRLAALRVRGDAGPSEQRLASYLQRLVGQEVFNVHRAERHLLLADDIPGLDVRLSLRPLAGGEPGELIGEIAVLRRRGTLDLNIQNFGSRPLGRFGGLLRGEVFDLTGMGDRTSLSVFSTADFKEQQTVQLAHDLLVGSNGLSLGGQVTLGWTEPSLDLPGFTVRSDTLFATLHANYPLVRRQAFSLFFTGGLDYVDQDVELNAFRVARDRVRTGFVRLGTVGSDTDSIARRNGYTPYEPRLRGTASIELRHGLDILAATPDCRGAAAAPCVVAGLAPGRIEQDPTPLLVRGQLGGEFRPVPAFTFAVETRAQYTRDPLPAFEEFTGGNYSTGRGYDPAAIIGDTGIASSIELRYGSMVPATPDSMAVQPFVFFDAARVWNRDPSMRPFNPDSLASAGGGLRLTHGGGMQGDVVVAVPLRRTDQQAEKGDVRFLVSLTTRLLPWRF